MRRWARRAGVLGTAVRMCLVLALVGTLGIGINLGQALAPRDNPLVPPPPVARADQDPTSCPDPIVLQNGSFETPVVAAGAGANISEGAAGLQWLTTATDGKVEYWRNGGNVQTANGNLPISAQSGSQWAELNANQASMLYQVLPTVPGQIMRWSLYHRARSTNSIAGDQTNTMQVKIGANTTDGTVRSNPAQPATYPNGSTSTSITTSDAGWVRYTGTYVVPAGQTQTAFGFEAISGSGGVTLGNFLDDIEFGNSPCVVTDKQVRNVTSTTAVTLPGDVLEYTVKATNNGGSPASLTQITDQIPANTTYVPGSIRIDGTARTDASGDDPAQFASGTVTANVGAGATSSAGGDLEPGESATLTFRVRVNSGTTSGTNVGNTAQTTYTWSPSSTVLTSTSQTTSTSTQTAGISLTKSIASTSPGSDNRLNVGDTINYRFVVRNTGTAVMTSVGVNDPKIATVNCPQTTLAGGASMTCTGTYTITQADVDAGRADNSATATGTPSGHTPITSTVSPTSQPLDTTRSLSLTKTAAITKDNGDGVPGPNDIVTYTFTVRNTGSVTINNIAINDPLPGMGQIRCDRTSLGQGQSTTCTATYTVTVANANAGGVDNSATVSGTAPTGQTVTAGPATARVDLPARPGLSVDKSSAAVNDANGNGRQDAGDTIAYTVVITNTGNVTLSQVAVNDPKVPVTCPATSIDPGAKITCTATYRITQADMDAGGVQNTASVTSRTPTGETVTGSDGDQRTLTSTAAMTFAKQAGDVVDANNNRRQDAGDRIDYVFTIVNTGSATINNLTISDSQLNGPVTCTATSLAPGGTATCTGSHTITQAEVDAGKVDNTATARGTATNGQQLSRTASATKTVAGSPSVTIDKQLVGITQADPNIVRPGDVINYRFLVTNTGAVTLSGVTVTDTRVPGPLTCPATLAPGATGTCTGSYTITQTDIDAGAVTNTATVRGTAPGNVPVSSNDTQTTPLPPQPRLAMTKSGTFNDANNNQRADVNETISYTFVVTNTGNVTLTAVGVNDPKAAPVNCPTTTLAPNASTTCTATYRLTQADIDLGRVDNQATATGQPPTGDPVTAPATARVPLPVVAGITLVKTHAPTIADTNNSNSVNAGDTVTYRFTLTNTGNVTLNSVTLTDNRVAQTNCPATLAPGQQVTCTGTYVLTQADFNAARVVNQATVSGTPASGGAAVTATGTDTLDLPVRAGIALTKRAGTLVDNDNNGTDEGDTLPYTFTVTNTGNQTLTAIQVADNLIPGVTCPTAPLQPGAQTTCTGNYTLTQTDIDNRSVVNAATVQGTPPSGPNVTANATATTRLETTASIALDKTAGPIVDADGNGPDAGDTVTYSFLVTNTGNETLRGVTIDDARTGGASCPTDPLAPGQSVTCTATYTLTQTDVDAGVVNNSATVRGTRPGGETVSATDANRLDIPRRADLSFDKQASSVQDTNDSGVVDAGDTITYTFVFENTGTVTLSDIALDDSLVDPTGCPTTLAPGARATCQATYTLTAADLDDPSGEKVNTATATATAPGSDPLERTDSTTTPLDAESQLSLDKTAADPVDANGNGRIDAGDTISYSFVVSNVGARTIDNVTVTDPRVPALNCSVASLAAGDSHDCGSVTYTITQADVNSGLVDNTATAAGTDPDGEPVEATDTTSTEITPVESIDLTKTAGPVVDDGSGELSPGDTITYTFVVTNTGSVTLSNVTLTDTLLGGAVACPQAATLEPGVPVTCTATYTLTQADIDAGIVENTATATGRAPDGEQPSDTASAERELDVAPAISLDKQASAIADANGSEVDDEGDTISYTFVVTNSGNQTLSNIVVADPRLPELDCTIRPLAPGESASCTATYTLTQADIDAGTVENTATVEAESPTGATVDSTDSTEVPVADAAQIQLDKVAGDVVDANGDGVLNAGDTIDYDLFVSNPGNATLDDVVLSDPLLGGDLTCPQGDIGTLRPRDSMRCGSFTYTLTQADIDAGVRDNTATATATSSFGGTETATDDTSTPLARTPALDLTKSAAAPADANNTQRTDAGDTIAYTFVITNTGNVTLEALAINDPKITDVTCPPGALDPGKTRTCTATYTLTQADIDAGTVLNEATATGQGANGSGTASDSATAERELDVTTTMTLDKRAGGVVDTNESGRDDAGDTVDYTFVITNTGATTLNNVTLTDPLVQGTLSCPTRTIAPGESITCTGSHALTIEDLNAGEVINNASVTGVSPTGTTASAADDATVTLTRDPGIALDKQAGPIVDANNSGRTDRGDTIDYRFVVTNSGNVTLDTVTISDPKIGAVNCPTGALAPGGSIECTATYTLSQDDIDSGSVDNRAQVSANAPGDQSVRAADETSVPITQGPAIQLDKQASAPIDANNNDRIDAGDTIRYTFVITNNGNTRISGIAVSDPRIGPISCPPANLDPGQSATCVLDYTLTQPDLDAGEVINVATASGTSPRGERVESVDRTTSTLPEIKKMTLDKQAVLVDAGNNGRIDAGDRIDYTFVVTNEGNRTLRLLEVLDEQAAVDCPVTDVAPLRTVTCTASYVITQDDIDAGSVANVATAVAVDPSGETVSSTDSTDVPITPGPAISLDKSVREIVDVNFGPYSQPGRVDRGDQAVYDFVVHNTGNVTLTDVVIADPRLGALVACPTTSLAPDEEMTCTARYTITQRDLDAGSVTNNASVSGTPPTGNPVSDDATARVALPAEPGMTLTKDVGEVVDADSDGRLSEGDLLRYTFAITNTGNVTIDFIRVEDSLLPAGTSCPRPNLIPSATMTCTGEYRISQTDIDAGSLRNVATGIGQTPDGTPISATGDHIQPMPGAPNATFSKQVASFTDANGDGRIAAGDVVNYTFSVRNTGNVTLNSGTIDDPLLGGTVPDCTFNNVAPGTSATCRGQYTLKQADVDAGVVDNTATLSIQAPDGTTLERSDDAQARLANKPEIGLVKSGGGVVDLDDNGSDAGDRIDYTFEVTNTGPSTVDQISISDPLVPNVTCPTGPLDPGKSVTCTGSHTLTLAEVNAGQVRNTATASAVGPNDQPASATDSVTTPIDAKPQLSLDKRSSDPVDVDGDGRIESGERIDYTFVVRNTGSVTLTEVGVNDPKVGAVTCPNTTLDPGQEVTCTASYTLSQADVDSGEVENTATASGTPPLGVAVKATDTETTTVPREATIVLDKQAGTPVDANNSNRLDAGDKIDYTFTITNTGTTSVTDLAVDDSLLGDTGVTCPTTRLGPGESTTCSGSYELTQADINNRRVANDATATGRGADGEPVSDDDSALSTFDPARSLSLDKSAGDIVDANGNGRTDAGDTVDYTFLVTNTGASTLTNVEVSDPKVGAVTCPTDTLLPRQSTTCTATYTLSQDDLDAASVLNVATASGLAGTDPVTAEDRNVLDYDAPSGITITKASGGVVDVNGNDRDDDGDRIDYTFTVRNTGVTRLSDVRVTDPLVSVICPKTTLDPGETMTCTGSLRVGVEDVDRGEVRNTADVAAQPPGGAPVEDQSNTVVTPITPEPAISVTKASGGVVDANGNQRVDAGDTIDYAFRVVNTGSVTLTDVALSDPLLPDLDCPIGTLAPGAARDCTATYTLTLADVNRGRVDNTASVTGTPPTGDPVDDSASATTPVNGSPDFTFTKTAGDIVDANNDRRVDAGDTITYTFTVTNTGAVTLTDLAIDDSRVGTVTCPSGALDPGDERVCTATYTLTQADIDAGEVINDATASATPPQGDPLTRPGRSRTEIDGAPGLAVEKTAGAPNDANGNGRIDAGETIAYSFTVTNTGTVTLRNVTLSDPKVGVLTNCDPRDLAPGASFDCTATYLIDQDDLNTGEVVNSATATGQPPEGEPVSGADSTTTPLDPAAAIELEKQGSSIIDANESGRQDAGDRIDYTFTLTNTGNVTLTRLAVSDPRIGDVTCPDISLPPGESANCTASYTVTQADANAGTVPNQATASGQPPAGDPVSDDDATSVDFAQGPALSFEKSAGEVIDVDGNGPDAGDAIDYTFRVTNTGNVTLTGVTVSDPLLPALDCPARDLEPGEAFTCTGRYTLTQPDVDAAQVANLATVTGRPPTGPEVTEEGRTTTDIAPAPGIGLNKLSDLPVDANDSGRLDEGDTIAYRFEITNTGNVTLTDLTVTDPLVGAVTCPTEPLGPGLTTACTAIYTITQADLDAGTVDNSATASGTPPRGGAVQADDTDSEPLNPEARIAVEKDADPIEDTNGSGRLDQGDTVPFTFLVTNTGAVTLTDITIADPLIAQVDCPADPIAPGKSVTCTGRYVLTQADVNAGQVVNTAVATGTPPRGETVNDGAEKTVPLERRPEVSLTKSAGPIEDTNGSGRIDADDQISYTFAVVNTGNVTLTELRVDDPLAQVVCPETSLEPGASMTCTATYTLRQGDVDAEVVRNDAQVTGTAPGGATVTDDSGVTTPVPAEPSLDLVKAASEPVDANANGRVDVGEVINYTLTVTNNGQQTVADVAITDPLITLDPACTPRTLAPGGSYSCTGAYELSQADIDAGELINTARTNGTDPTGAAVSDEAGTRTPLTAQPAIAVDKQAGTPIDDNGNGRLDQGDRIDYTFLVTNTGNVTLTDIAVNDPLIADVTCPITQLAPGAQTTCAASYTLTQADIDAGTVENTATATGTDPNGGEAQGSDDTSVPFDPERGLSVDKTAGEVADANGNGRVDAGDTIDYAFKVTNTGVINLTDVTLTDSLLSGLACPPADLGPGQSFECSGTYTLTQADLDAAQVVNVADAVGTAPDGTPVTGSDRNVAPVSQDPAITLDKQAGPLVDIDGSGTATAGDQITYTFDVVNTGTVTLREVVVTDPKVGLDCRTDDLAPGEPLTCTATYTLSQDDVDAGSVENTASVAGLPPVGPTVGAEDSTSVPLDPAQGLTVDKRASAINDVNGNGVADAGDTIDYTFTVTNTGNVTLTGVELADPLVAIPDCPVVDMAPKQSFDCAATYTLTQADVDAGVVRNTATATGTDPTGGTVSGDDSTETDVPEARGVSIEKAGSSPYDANGNGRIDAGDAVDYRFTVTNTGNVTLSDLAVSDPLIETITCERTELAPGATTTCEGSYSLTQDDVDRERVDNTATVNGTTPGGATATDEDSTRVPVDTSRSLSVVKTGDAPADANGSGRVDAGDTIAYSFTVTNTGTVRLTGVTLTDPLVPGMDCPARDLRPGESFDCTATYTLTPADADAGQVVNTATATGTDPAGTPVSGTGFEDVDFTAPGALTVDKQGGPVVDANGSGATDAGDTIEYTFVAQNTGAVTLTDVRVSDPRLPNLECVAASLPAGGELRCAGTYTLTQDDVDAGDLQNTATATGTTPGGDEVGGTDTVVTPLAPGGGLTVRKVAEPIADTNASGVPDAGDQITYRFTVTNAGNVTLTGVTLSDPLVAIADCPARTLAPGASFDCSATYTLTQADVDAGSVVNTATAIGTRPSGEQVDGTDTATSPVERRPGVRLDKVASTPIDANENGRVDAGDRIDYLLEVTNVGNVSLTDVRVSDPMLTDLSCPGTDLGAGRTMTCVGSHTLTQADIDRGQVRNDANVTGTPPGVDPISSGDHATVIIDPDRSISVVKTAADPVDANGSGRTDAGDTVQYSFTVTNTGTARLTAVTLTDPLVPGMECAPRDLAPGASYDCTATYTLTQADIDAGEVVNTASASGTDPDGATIVGDDFAVIEPGGAGSLAVDKRADPVTDVNGNDRIDAGDQIAYTIVVTNDGSVTLNEIVVSDPLLPALACPPAGPLAPGDSLECTGVHTLTQADIDAGGVENTATATGRTPNGAEVGGDDTVSTPLPGGPAVALDKQAGAVTDANGNGRVDAGDQIAYVFQISNTGSTTLSSVVVDDPRIGAIGCPSGALAPGETRACGPVSYPLTQADVDAGEVINTATVTGQPVGGGEVTATDSVTTPVRGVGGVALEKRVAGIVDSNGSGRTDAGDSVNYEFTVTNTGAVSLDQVAIQDPLIDAVACGTTSLAPGASTTCTGSYRLTQDDVDAGSVENAATVSGRTPSGEAVDAGDSTSTPVDGKAGLSIDKIAELADTDGDGLGDVGEKIHYRFVVTNTGSTRVSDVRVSDPRLTDIGIRVDCPAGLSLEPGRSGECGADYVITDGDIRAGEVVNVATATGVAPGGTPVVSGDGSARIAIDPGPAEEPTPPWYPEPLPKPGELARTGAMLGTSALLGGLLLPLAGGLILLVQRLRRRDED